MTSPRRQLSWAGNPPKESLLAPLDRRVALRRLALGGLGPARLPLWASSLVARAEAHAPHAHAAASAGTALRTPKVLTSAQDRTVTVLAELIVPETDTPGAKTALVNRYIDEVFAQQTAFVAALACGEDCGLEEPGTGFVELVRGPEGSREDAKERTFFAVLKDLTIIGYCTSEVGLHEEPGTIDEMWRGGFEGCARREHGAPPASAGRE